MLGPLLGAQHLLPELDALPRPPCFLLSPYVHIGSIFWKFYSCKVRGLVFSKPRSVSRVISTLTCHPYQSIWSFQRRFADLHHSPVPPIRKFQAEALQTSYNQRKMTMCVTVAFFLFSTQSRLLLVQISGDSSSAASRKRSSSVPSSNGRRSFQKRLGKCFWGNFEYNSVFSQKWLICSVIVVWSLLSELRGRRGPTMGGSTLPVARRGPRNVIYFGLSTPPCIMRTIRRTPLKA